MKLKKAISVFLAVIVMSSCVATAAPDENVKKLQNLLSNFAKTSTYDNSFTDISGNCAEEHIINAYEYGIICGVGGDQYDADGYFTVAQAVTVATRLHMTYRYSDEGQSVMDRYASDTVFDHWAAPFLAYAEGEGLIDDGWSGVLDKPATRAETILILSKILQPKDMARLNTVNSLPDVNLSTPYFAEIVLFYEAGIIQGSTINGVQNCFSPNSTLSRAEAASIFMMMVEADKRITDQIYGEKTSEILAGTGTSGFSDKTAAIASFTLPYGLTVDNSGRIIIFDTYNNAIRIIHNSKVETMAGIYIAGDENNLSKGFYRDGPLSEALFNRPTDGVYNANGDLFICDSENHVIRLIKNGKVYTFAGTSQGYADGKSDFAKFNTPTSIAIDENGNMYVTDTMNNCIRKIDTKGNVTTVAGNAGVSGYANGNAAASLFRDPSGIAVSNDGSVIYVADTGNHVIRKIENGKVTTLSGVIAETDEEGDPVGSYQNGTAEEAMYNLPRGLALAGDILFVADSGNNVIRAVNMNGYVFTAAGTGEPGDREGGNLTTEFNQPTGVLWHNGILYISDTANNMIKKLSIEEVLYRGGYSNH